MLVEALASRRFLLTQATCWWAPPLTLLASALAVGEVSAVNQVDVFIDNVTYTTAIEAPEPTTLVLVARDVVSNLL